MKILAIDLGGTSAKIGLFYDDELIKKWQIETDKSNVWGNIKNNLEDLNDHEYDIISISMPGFIDHKKNIVKLSGNLNWKDYDIVENVRKYFPNKKIYVINDANSAALGEYWKGAGANASSMVLYTIGTGIGGGIVIDGKLVFGSNGYAGELGHGGYFQNKYECACGLKYCVEPVSSATGMNRLLKEKGYNITLVEAGKLLHEGDEKIKEFFREALLPLALHIVVMETSINPEIIVIGGGPSQIGEPLRKIIENLVKENQLDFIAESTKIQIATTKNDAGMLGAVYWAKQKQNKI